MRLRNCLPMVALTLILASPTAEADPCGMVPPIYVGDQVPIARVGYQQTYVFYKDGLETFIIHPGFKGKVEEFGMLIPFPAVPSLRKVSDNIFPHLAAAVDPPEVVVDLRQRFLPQLARANSAVPSAPSAAPGLAIKEDAVRVIKEEAVGMYEVAVLEAGSPKALERWMDDHGYKYPKGMDAACADYVKQKWCFVAVKTKVAEKKGIDPQPGQRNIDAKLPDGSSFEGEVQAMGFRFKVGKMVVPMRLSTFNEGDLHNVVYILSDNPMKIKSVPEEYVVRQIPGSDLHRNVTGPLPLRIIGGTVDQIPAWQKQNLKQRRDPQPHNGAAKDLFAADLLALANDQLSHEYEEDEKMLLMIGERLSLRGQEIDRLNEGALKDQRDKTVAGALDALKSDLTLSVIDGNFPREVLANQNLAFAPYKMPARRNKSEFYNAKKKGPGPKQEGIITFESVSMNEVPQEESLPVVKTEQPWLWGFSLLFSSMAVGLIVSLKRVRSFMTALLMLAFVFNGSALMAGGKDTAADAKEEVKQLSGKEILNLIDQLGDPKKAEDAAATLVKQGEPAVPHLIGEAVEGNDMALRGWAIVCISEIGGKEANARLTEMQNDQKQSPLIRTWAAAGRVHMAKNTDELLELASLIPQYPALGRPIGKRLLASLTADGTEVNAAQMLEITLKVPQLQQSMVPAIMNLGSEKLVVAMATAKNQNVRRQAAAYLATLANQGTKTVPDDVVNVYDFDPKAKTVPWEGGPLFLPGLRWQKKEAQELVSNLISWYIWCEEHNQKTHHQALHNNLRSLQLAAAAGYKSPGFGQATTDQWVAIWGQAIGKEGLKKLLAAQDLTEKPRYQKILESL